MSDVSKATLLAIREYLKGADNHGVKAPQRRPNPRGMQLVRRLLRERRAKRNS